MRITELGRTAVGAEVKFSAQVDGKELWFKFRAVTGDCSASKILVGEPQAAPFLVAVLLLAMQKGEDIWVDLPVSKELLGGIEKYQAQFHAWFPHRFSIIKIHARTAEIPSSLHTKSAHACAFSGGVDSFYSFLELSSPQLASAPLTDALFMAGFDMPLNLTTSIQELTDSYADLMRGAGVRFWVGATNVRVFVNTVDWTNAHGQALVASALFFDTLWDSFTIPSSYLRDSHPRWGTHPDLDPLLSTESLRFLHHGAEMHRVDKLRRIIQSSTAEARLRVCWIQDIGLRNCGDCEKCLRTMAALDLLNALPRYSTFPAKRVPLMKLIRLSQRSVQSRIFSRELIREALKRRRWKIAAALLLSLGLRRARRWKQQATTWLRGRQIRPS